MYLIEPSDGQNELGVLLSNWLGNNDRAHQAHEGTTKIALARSTSRGVGIRKGVALGVAAMLTKIRGEYCAKWPRVEMISSFDVESYLRDHEAEWDKHQAKSHTGRMTAEEREERQKWRDDFITKMVNELHDLAISDQIKATELERHQRAVLQKAEEPTEEDREWLDAKLKQAQQLWNEIAGLIPEDVAADIEKDEADKA